MSAYASLPDGISAGRLIKDIDPPGFDSLGSFAAEPGTIRRSHEPVRVNLKSPDAGLKTRQKLTAAAEESRLKSASGQIGRGKTFAPEARRAVAVARSRAKNLEAAQKKAEAETKEAEKHRREAERRLKEATAVRGAIRRSQTYGRVRTGERL